ncbi:class I SAM-dependent methyltransferase [Patescibacteria group bacterium]
MNFWSKYHEVYDKFLSISPTYQLLASQVIKAASIKKNDKVLDAGCGTGYITKKVAETTPNVTSVDNSSAALDFVRRTVPVAKVFKQDLSKQLNLESDYFDCVICVNALYTLNKGVLDNTFREFSRILKNGGLLIITDPGVGFSNMKIFYSDMKIIFNQTGFRHLLGILRMNLVLYLKLMIYNIIIDLKDAQGKYTFFTENKYIELLNKNNFSILLMKKSYSDQNIFAIAKNK